MSVPKLRFPVRFNGPKAATVEQNTGADHAQRALLVLSYPRGACVDLPGFGTPDTTFGVPGTDIDTLVDAVLQWEPDISPSAIRTVLDADGTDHINFDV